jgi:hypothetical protein
MRCKETAFSLIIISTGIFCDTVKNIIVKRDSISVPYYLEGISDR